MKHVTRRLQLAPRKTLGCRETVAFFREIWPALPTLPASDGFSIFAMLGTTLDPVKMRTRNSCAERLIYHFDPELWFFVRGGKERNDYSQEDQIIYHAWCWGGMGTDWSNASICRT